MNNLAGTIAKLSEKYFEEVLTHRRHLHANPELSFEEHNTAAYIKSTLASFGIEDVHIVGKTGVTFCLNVHIFDSEGS